MPSFAYTARNASGKTTEATLDAPSRKDALRMLSARGLTPIRIDERTAGGAVKRPAAKSSSSAATSGGAPARSAATGNARNKPASGAPAAAAGSFSFGTPRIRLKRAHRLPFLQSLHELTTSGLSAGEAVRLLAMRVSDPALKLLCGGIWERISEGATLSGALAGFPDVFDDATLNLIEAGEATGNINDVLARLIAHLTEQKELQRQLAAALAYPIFLSVVAFGVVLFFLFFLMPRLQALFTALKGELPISTKILLGMSDFALHYGLFVGIGLVFCVISFWRWRQTEAGRQTTDAWMLQLPLIGPFSVAQTVLSFSQTLSVLLENGITASEALRMTERQIGNRVHREAFREATGRVLEGEALSQALVRTGCFPDLVIDQLSIGENTGNIVPSLRKVAQNFQRNVSDQLNIFTKVIGSGVLLTVFFFVGFIAFAIVSAVFQLSSSIKM